MSRFIIMLCGLSMLTVQFHKTISQEVRSGVNSQNVDNDTVFENLAGNDADYHGRDDRSYSKLDSKNTESAASPTEEMIRTSGISEKSQNSSEDDKFLKTIMYFSSTAIGWLKSYLKHSYKEIPNPSECVNDTARLVSSALSREKWTIPFIDAQGKPGPSVTQGWFNFFGNLEQCEDASAPLPKAFSHRKKVRGFKGKYCLLTLAFKSNSLKSIRAQSKIGVCVPDSCSDPELKSHSSQILRKYKADKYITLVSVECLENDPEVKLITILAIILLVVVGGLVILGTAYDLICIQNSNSPSQNGFGILDNCSNSLESAVIDCNTKSKNYDTITPSQSGNSKQIDSSEKNFQLHPFVSDLLLAFSAYTNGKTILCTSTKSGTIGSLSGIRFLSMAWVTLGHAYLFGRSSAVNVISAMTDYFDRWTFGPVANPFFAVDSFFALSGILNSFLHLQRMNDKASWKINWPKYYFHRVWRLTPPYIAVLVISQGLSPYLGDGSMWENDQPFDHKDCKDKWWQNVLYINNFDDLMDACMPHTWYLANDLQFYVIAPLIMIPLFLYPIAGLVCSGALLVGCWITTGVLSTKNSWNTVWFFKCMTFQGVSDYANDYYVKPWNRFGPYIVGILAGFVLNKFKGKSVKLKWWSVALGWGLSTISALAIIYGVYGDYSCKERNSKEVAALFHSVSRSIWGLVICWIVIACHFGYGGPVNTLLSWGPFHVLSRLTFLAYLLQPYVYTIFYSNLDQPYYMKDLTMVVYFLGILVVNLCLAFLFMLMFESPMVRLENIVLGKKNNK